MKNIVLVILMLFVAGLFAGCGSSDNSEQLAAQQAQVAALQADLATIQTQLASAQDQGVTYSAGIDTAIASLTLTQNSLAQLTGQPASTANTIALTTASNQVLVLQSLADSLTSNTTSAAADYAASTASLSALTDQKTTLQAQLADLTSQIAAADTDNAAQTAQLVELNEQITTLSGQIDTLQAASNTLSDQLAAAGSTIDTQAATITSLNASVTALSAIIDAMVATAIPVPLSASALSAMVATDITVTASFPAALNGESATFSATGGSLASTSVVIVAGSASTTFSSATAGSFNLYAVQGAYVGGVVISITNTPRSFAYAHNFFEGTVSAFSIDEGTGALTALAGSPFAAGEMPIDIALTPSGKYAFIANVTDGTISTYAVNSRTGALEAIAGETVSAAGAGSITWMAVDSSGTHLYATDPDADNIYAFTINPASGALSPVSGSPFAADASPLELVLDPAGTHLYVTTNAGGASTISVYNIDAFGALSPVAGSPFARGAIPSDYISSPLVLATDALGNNRLYTTDPAGRVLGYAIDAASGALDPPASFDCGDSVYPAFLAVDPSGEHVYLSAVVGSTTYPFESSFYTLSVDASSGTLSLVSSAPVSAYPPRLVMSPSGQYLYGITYEGSISTWDIQGATATPAYTGIGTMTDGTYNFSMVTITLP